MPQHTAHGLLRRARLRRLARVQGMRRIRMPRARAAPLPCADTRACHTRTAARHARGRAGMRVACVHGSEGARACSTQRARAALEMYGITCAAPRTAHGAAYLALMSRQGQGGKFPRTRVRGSSPLTCKGKCSMAAPPCVKPVDLASTMIPLDSKSLSPSGVATVGGPVGRIRSKPLAELAELLAAWQRPVAPGSQELRWKERESAQAPTHAHLLVSILHTL